MADKPASERTEKPTAERLRKARQEGQVPQSQEVPSALMFTTLLIVMALTAGWMWRWVVRQMQQGLSFQVSGSLTSSTFNELLRVGCMDYLVVMSPLLLALFVVSAFSSVLVGGWAFAPKALRMDLSRISPIKGFKNLVSLRSLVKLLISIAKLIVLLTIAWQYLDGQMDRLLSLQWSSPAATMCIFGGMILGLVARITVALVAIAGVDWLYQRWNHRRELRMTRQEIKEERKQYEVSPEVKGRIRSKQLAMAQRRALQDVPDADVIVTNPTHYAVALRYDPDTMGAPEVVAKGVDYLCQKIKEIAFEHDVPIIEKPELARALYASAEPGDAIPETLFVAVAEVLAMLYRLRKKNRLPSKAHRT